MRRLPIEQADADQGNAERARRLEELAGNGTKATCVDRQRVGEGELRGKEGDLETAVLAVGLREPGPGAIRLVGGRVLDDGGCERRKIRVGREPLLHGRPVPGRPAGGAAIRERTVRRRGRGAQKARACVPARSIAGSSQRRGGHRTRRPVGAISSELTDEP